MCYMELQKNIGTIDDGDPNEGSEMCINTEWGAFGDNSGALDSVKTFYDEIVDSESPNKGQHVYVVSRDAYYRINKKSLKIYYKIFEPNLPIFLKPRNRFFRLS